MIRNQKQAESLAQRLINEEISRQDAKAKATADSVPAPPQGFTVEPKNAEVTAGGEVPAQTFKVGDRITLPGGQTGTIKKLTRNLARGAIEGGGRVHRPSIKVASGARAEQVSPGETTPLLSEKPSETQAQAIPAPPEGFKAGEVLPRTKSHRIGKSK